MVDDYAALGFEMDCSHAFSEKYGQAANNHEVLDKIIDDVTDIPLPCARYRWIWMICMCLMEITNRM